MASEIFSDWFRNTLVPSVKKYFRGNKLHVKTSLDSALSHPFTDILQSSDKTITAIYLTAKITSLVQPMDQGVLELG